MNMNKIIIVGYESSEPLSKQDTYDLLYKINMGDEKAKYKLAEHNIGLVLYEVKNKFADIEYDKNDLVSIGFVGLMKAINTFDISRNVEFATYASRCIDNEILMFLRKYKKYINDISLNYSISYDKEGNELKIEDTLRNDNDIVENYMDNEIHIIIREIVNKLPERHREICKLYFGFYNDRIYSQKEISEMFNISQSHVSRLIKKIIKLVREELEDKGYIGLKNEVTNIDNQKVHRLVKKSNTNKINI